MHASTRKLDRLKAGSRSNCGWSTDSLVTGPDKHAEKQSSRFLHVSTRKLDRKQVKAMKLVKQERNNTDQANKTRRVNLLLYWLFNVLKTDKQNKTDKIVFSDRPARQRI